jgi:hypothetical protein
MKKRLSAIIKSSDEIYVRAIAKNMSTLGFFTIVKKLGKKFILYA